MPSLAVWAVKQLNAGTLEADLRACGDRQLVVADCELCAIARLGAGYLLGLHGRPASGPLHIQRAATCPPQLPVESLHCTSYGSKH